VYKVQATLSLGDKFSTEVEKVGERALSFGNTRCKSIKTILEQGISDAYGEPHSSLPLSELGQRFFCNPSYFASGVACLKKNPM